LINSIGGKVIVFLR